MLVTRFDENRKSGTFKRAFVLLLALVITFSLLPVAPQGALAVTSAEKQAEADALVKQLDVLQTELESAKTKLTEAIAAENAATGLKEEARSREEAAEKLTAELQKKLGERAVETYRRGEISYLDVLFGANSFSEFITTWEFVSRINESDAALTQQSKNARKEAEDARILYTEQERIASQKRIEIAELEASLEQKSSQMSSELEKMNEEIQELLAQEEAAAEAARAAAAAAAAAQNGSKVDPKLVAKLGDFVHPCPSGSISSTFGWRDFDHSYHQGLDLAAPTGTPIYAARGGTVIISGYNGSAGYWVVIAHGGGLVTKYMHAYQQPNVSAGQSVSAGDLIAGVGNTGNSFGAHLHFQLEINGVAVDPYPFLY